VTDGHTDRQTDGHMTTAYTAQALCHMVKMTKILHKLAKFSVFTYNSLMHHCFSSSSHDS